MRPSESIPVGELERPSRSQGEEASSSSSHAAMSDRPSPSDRFEALLCDLRSDNPNRRIPAVRLARDQRLQDPAHVGAIVALWQQAENEHVRAGAGEVLVAVAPQLMAPHP